MVTGSEGIESYAWGSWCCFEIGNCVTAVFQVLGTMDGGLASILTSGGGDEALGLAGCRWTRGCGDAYYRGRQGQQAIRVRGHPLRRLATSKLG